MRSCGTCPYVACPPGSFLLCADLADLAVVLPKVFDAVTAQAPGDVEDLGLGPASLDEPDDPPDERRIDHGDHVSGIQPLAFVSELRVGQRLEVHQHGVGAMIVAEDDGRNRFILGHLDGVQECGHVVIDGHALDVDGLNLLGCHEIPFVGGFAWLQTHHDALVARQNTGS